MHDQSRTENSIRDFQIGIRRYVVLHFVCHSNTLDVLILFGKTQWNDENTTILDHDKMHDRLNSESVMPQFIHYEVSAVFVRHF